MRGSASGGGVGQTQHRILRDTVNEWAVRIQLECFLVWLTFLTENCMEMNEIGPGAFPVPPLWIRSWRHFNTYLGGFEFSPHSRAGIAQSVERLACLISHCERQHDSSWFRVPPMPCRNVEETAPLPCWLPRGQQVSHQR